jgi:hypothetical protein
MRRRLRRALAEFFEQTADCRAVQQRTLQSLFALNRESHFARDFKLAGASSSADLRQRVPVSSYELFRPYIDQMKAGDHRGLLGSQNELLMFSLSSGTTSESKFIPITRQFFDDYRRGWQFWGIRAFDEHAGLMKSTILQISSDYDRFRTEGGTPCGNISGLAAKVQHPAVKLLYTLPYEVVQIPEPEARYYTSMRLAVADPHIGMITTANPSTLVHMAQLADAQREPIIRDIFDGRVTSPFELPPAVRKALSKRLDRPDRNRARELEKIVERTGHLHPADYWQRLEVITVWTGGSCASYLPAVRELYGNKPVRDHGLSASEGRMTIPFEDESPDGILDVLSHYFEFIPEAEYGSANPTVLEAHELEEGHNYFILLSTCSGFYRYDICDVVRCTGFMGTVPILRFLHKGAHISSVTGEKLSESHVVDAMQSTLREFDHRVNFFTLIPVWGEPPYYRLLLEEGEVPSAGRLQKFEELLDRRLGEQNCEYREKRDTGRLAPLRVLPLRSGSWTEFARQRRAKIGGSVEQYKHPCLLPRLEVAEKMASEFALK